MNCRDRGRMMGVQAPASAAQRSGGTGWRIRGADGVGTVWEGIGE